MSVQAESTIPQRRTPSTAAVARLRRGNLAVLVLLVVEYVIGAYVSIYVTVPSADHGGSLDRAISAGPAWLSVHAMLGLLLGLGALGALTQAILVRRWSLIASSAIACSRWPSRRLRGPASPAPEMTPHRWRWRRSPA